MGEGIKVSNFIIQGLGPSRDVVKWMYDPNTKLDDVSTVFNLNNQRFIIAKLAAETDKGLTGLNRQNKPLITQKVIEEKKLELIKKKFAGTPIDAIATQLNTPLQQYDSLKLGSSYVPELGYESKLVGYVFCPSFQLNTVSPPIPGQGGVYFVTVTNRQDVEDPNAMQAVMQQRRMQEMQMRNYMSQMLQQVIVDKANIKYNPANF